MVGGSVSGKTFKPDPSSYEATGIPCGNPQRYKNRSVMRMVPNKEVPCENQQLGLPGKGTKSEAEDHLQEMLKTQLDTNVTFHGASRKRKAFTEPIIHDTSQEKASGVMTLSDYNKFDTYQQKEAEFTQLGLTGDEVKLKMADYGLLRKDSTRSNYGVNPEVEHDRRKAIQDKIKSKEQKLSQEISFSNVRKMSRHAMEVEKSLNRGTEKSNAFSHLLHSEQKFDPALDEVLKEYNEKNNSMNSNVERKTLGVQENVICLSDQPDDEPDDECTTDSCSERILPLDEEVIKRHRLTLDDIRAIPRFKDYQPGSPNEVLYIKNLSKKVSEADLHALFNRYEDGVQKFHIRFMTGRMKGQAFVTFGVFLYILR
ncbi:RNA-binding protein 41-like isoform X2 [Dendronephthya gigantea]|uniref:RNA-binding protein 41-like isoform X2 n=1 Tax=Dendronephthya gigantea TaxID=151771 RepID=UPI00106AFBDF|nr:RNA-binding protein 41-like isoform X2 [Dendronephthya gigantea]